MACLLAMQNFIGDEKPLISHYLVTQYCAYSYYLFIYPGKLIIGHHTFVDDSLSVNYIKSAIFHYGPCLDEVVRYLVETYRNTKKPSTTKEFGIKSVKCNNVEITRNLPDGSLLKIQKLSDSGKSRLQNLFTPFVVFRHYPLHFQINTQFSV